jgi:hypothetical protein
MWIQMIIGIISGVILRQARRRRGKTQQRTVEYNVDQQDEQHERHDHP